MPGDPMNPRSGEVEAILSAAHDPCVEMEKDLYYAAQAFLELTMCYRLGRTPSERLFKNLEKAKVTMDRAKEKLGV